MLSVQDRPNYFREVKRDALRTEEVKRGRFADREEAAKAGRSAYLVAKRGRFVYIER